ncbi:MAG: NAD-dependent epimerase/dehydratase family protein [Anaerolineae bacterium]
MSAIKRVVVTGSAGKAGRFVVADLVANGYKVKRVVRRPTNSEEDYKVDLCDLGQVYGMLEGQEAVVHLAAIPWPGEHPPEVVYRNNVVSTFNVLQACYTLGVKKVVIAGSEAALGFPFATHAILPQYLPIDEEHPLLAQDAYGLSKIANEETARGFARRAPDMSILMLRLSFVIPPEDMAGILRQAWANPRGFDFNFWAYIDARDTARAFRLALECDHRGYDAVYIAAPDTLMREPTLELLQRYHPGPYRIAEGYGGRMSPLDVSKAESLLGFRAEYTWDKVVKPEDLA